jgi:hypothetical protein
MTKPVLYCLVDTETTMKNGLVFDFAFDLMNRKGETLEYGSFLFKDVLTIEEPFYKEKVAEYWTLAYKHKVKPMTVAAVRRVFNHVLNKYISKGYKIVICAYNAAFDVSHLGLTSKEITGLPFLTADTKYVKFFDLWHGWVKGCPKEYGYTAPWTHEFPGTKNPKTGKPYPWNIKTSAEAVYRYISDNHNFQERHVAYADLIIEKVILLDILGRKKKLHIVDKPKDFVSHPWKLAQERCRGAIEFRRAKQQSMEGIIQHVPALSQKKGHGTELCLEDEMQKKDEERGN